MTVFCGRPGLWSLVVGVWSSVWGLACGCGLMACVSGSVDSCVDDFGDDFGFGALWTQGHGYAPRRIVFFDELSACPQLVG